MATQDIKELSFRQAMSELDSVVSTLESNTLELEESLKMYERGIGLLSELKARLNNAQQKVDVLMGELEASTDDTTTDTTLS